jgi:hypothetical protein
MAESTVETIDQLLAGAMERVDDEEARFKIRSARQLLDVIRHRHDGLDEAVNDAVDDEELAATLRDLGYLE